MGPQLKDCITPKPSTYVLLALGTHNLCLDCSRTRSVLGLNTTKPSVQVWYALPDPQLISGMLMSP